MGSKGEQALKMEDKKEEQGKGLARDSLQDWICHFCGSRG